MLGLAAGLSLAAFAQVSGAGEAAWSARALSRARHLAIQHNGRQKPLDSFARETLRFITGAPRVGGQDPVATVFSIVAEPERWQQRPLVTVPFVPLRDALGMAGQASRVSYDELVATRKLMRMLPPIVDKQQQDEKLSVVEHETLDVFQRFVALNGLLQHDLRLVPPPLAGATVSPAQHEWLSVRDLPGHAPERQQAVREAWNALVATVRAKEPQAVEASIEQFASQAQTANPGAYPDAWRLRLEVLYNGLRFFHLASCAYLFAGLALALSLAERFRAREWIGRGALWIGFTLHGVGIALRVVLGERPPVSNFYETTLWLPFVAVALALILDRFDRVRYVGLAAALLASLTLTLSDHLPLDASISPVVAVLRSNLWLTVHVLTIVASYGALALAAVLAHIYGFLYLRRAAHPAIPSVGALLYRTIQVGIVLLASGIMLGAVWANASWGRYWGWDPKETWALITLLWFLALLHGRFAGWIRGVGLALGTIGGLFSLLMTYYGVSFHLVGLHSYAGGHAKPLPALLVVYLIAELAFLLVVALAAAGRRGPSRT